LPASIGQRLVAGFACVLIDQRTLLGLLSQIVVKHHGAFWKFFHSSNSNITVVAKKRPHSPSSMVVVNAKQAQLVSSVISTVLGLSAAGTLTVLFFVHQFVLTNGDSVLFLEKPLP